MELYFNELSLLPMAASADEAKVRLRGLARELSKMKREGGLSIVRIAENFEGQYWSEHLTFKQIRNDSGIERKDRDFLFSILSYPYIAEDDDQGQDAFVNNRFETLDHEENTQIPDGLASAYLKSSFTFSLASHSRWQQAILRLQVNPGASDSTEESIINFSSPVLLQNPEYLAFKNARPPIFDSRKRVEEFFGPGFSFEDSAIEDLMICRSNGLHDRVIDLILEIRDYPFWGGRGRTEKLKHGTNRYSKRVSHGDRLVYTWDSTVTVIHQCLRHYDDK